MQVQVENDQNYIPLEDDLYALLEKVIEFALEEENFPKDCEVNLYLVNDEAIRAMNLEHRNIDKPTDVLSFPMAEIVKGKLMYESYDRNPDTDLLMLGDIVISAQRTLQQAQEYGHSMERELLFLLSHGMFHLLGYDHMTCEDEIEMMEKQEKVLSKVGLQRG